MARIVVFSDLHLFKWREFARIVDGRNDRLNDCALVFHSVAEAAQRHNASLIVFAGDLFHKKSILDTETFNLGMDGIASLRQWPVLMVPGNHDHATRDGRIHSLEAFRHMPHVWVAGQDLEPYKLQSFKILPVPYTDATTLINAVKGTTHDLAVVHAGFSGAKVGSYEYKPPEELLPSDLGPLPKGVTSVLSGHYHTPQHLLGGSIVYVGAPLQHTRSDAGDNDRGILVYDTEKRSVRREKLDAPRFVRLTDEDIQHKDESEWDVEGNFVDILLTEEPDGGIEKFKALCKHLPARGVNVVFTPPPSLPATRLEVDPSMSLTKMVGKYVEEFAPEGLDKKTLSNMFKEVL